MDKMELDTETRKLVFDLIRLYGVALPGVVEILDAISRFKLYERDDHCAVPLPSGEEFLVDKQDFWIISKYRFYKSNPGTHSTKDRPYRVYCEIAGDSKSKQVELHNLIMKPQKGFFVDWINGNRFDCRRANLRIANGSQNRIKRRRNPGKFGYIGISFSKKCPNRPYSAQLISKGRRFFSKKCATVEEAAREYDKLAKMVYGDFATLNFPDEA